MDSIPDIVREFRPSLAAYEDLYRGLHANPELTFMESETAATIATKLAELGSFKVTTGIGGHGLAGLLPNGDGPTILLRADMDALPVEERTGLSYASTKQMLDHDGKKQPVMHACGHDMHVSCCLGAAQLLLAARDHWSGTLLLVFQPAEEKGAGARAMVDDGLYTKHGLPLPDIVLGAHVTPDPAGSIGTRAGPFMPSADAIRITLHGRGGHASQPHSTVDPVMIAAYTVTSLQAIVSREVPAAEHAVVTVASIQAGSAENIIPSTAELKVNVRAYSEDVRKRVLASIKRIVCSISEAHGATAPPDFHQISSYPLTTNDSDVSDKVGQSFASYFGSAYDSTSTLSASEDFSILGSAIDRPCCFWLYGGTDPKLLANKNEDGTPQNIPGNHSPFFAPVIQPTLQAGLDAYALAALTFLLKKQ